MYPDIDIHRIAANQGGAVRFDQALSLGLSRRQIELRIHSGQWKPIGKGAYQVLEMDSPLERTRAAIAVLPGAVASHFSAAGLHGLTSLPTDRATVLVHTRTTHQFPGVKVYRCHDLIGEHVTTIDRTPTTSVARTIVDLAGEVSERHLGFIVDEAITSRKTTVEDVAEVLGDVARRGKPGVRKARSVLERRAGEPITASVLEARGVRLLREAGLTDFETEYPLPWALHRRFDLAFPDRHLAIEWDSRRWHSGIDTFERDRARDRDSVIHGWKLLRFTWTDVHQQPDSVVSTIRSALAV
jgi:very-short-patch-repair endonuclease